MHYNLVKASNRRYLEELKNKVHEMPVVYSSVNIMQHTEWVINKPIFEVIKKCMENDFPLGKLPVNPQTIELPIKPVDIGVNEEATITVSLDGSDIDNSSLTYSVSDDSNIQTSISGNVLTCYTNQFYIKNTSCIFF